MQIEDQIKALLRTKAKIDEYRRVIKYVTEDSTSTEEFDDKYPGLREEFTAELIEICNSRIEMLGNPVKPSAPKQMLETVENPIVKANPAPAENHGEPNDPLRFLQKYRHLDGKKVVYSSKDGDVQGVVRGMITPFLKVELNTGYVINAEPAKIRELT